MAIVRRKPRVRNGRLTQVGVKFRTYEECWGHAVFECDCGNNLVLSISDVSSGKHNSCGCIRREKSAITKIRRALENNFFTGYSIERIVEAITNTDDTGIVKHLRIYTYVLELDDSCWYIGRTANPSIRIKSHFKHSSIEWVRLHPPIRVHSVTKGDTERQLTLKMMKEYGWQKVRGYAWCKVGLSKPPIALKSVK